MRTFTGYVIGAGTQAITVRDDSGAEHTLHASGQVAAQAGAMIGRRVRFAVDFSERTERLTEVQLCVRSSYGLQAAEPANDTRTTGVRACVG
jgi:hypothetical protein